MPAPKRCPRGGPPRRPAVLGPLDPRWTSPFPADPRWFLAVLLATGLAVRLAALGLLLQAAGAGSSPWLLLPRLLSVLAGTAALVVFYHLGRRVSGVRLGLAAAAVMALAPAAWTAEARTASGGLLALAVGAATLSLLETGRRGRPPGGWAALAGLCALLPLLDPLGLAFLGGLLAWCLALPRATRLRAVGCVALGLLPALLGSAWLGAGLSLRGPEPAAGLRFLAAPADLSGALVPLSWQGWKGPAAGQPDLEPAAAASLSLGFWLLAALGWMRLGWRNRREATLLALVFLVPLVAAAVLSSVGMRGLQAADLAPLMAPFFLLVLLGMPTARLGMASAGLLVLVNLANAAFLLRRIP